MTAEEAQKLVKGDVVYYRAGGYRPNAIVGAYDVELARANVVKVTQKRVQTAHASLPFDVLMTEADGLAAIEAFKARAQKREDDDRRLKVAAGRIRACGFEVERYSDFRVIAHGPDAAERLADLLEVAHRAMMLRDQLNAALPVVDAPVILLPLSLAQAELVLDALRAEVEPLRAQGIEATP